MTDYENDVLESRGGMSGYEKTARKLIASKNPEAIEDALELCKALEKENSREIIGAGGNELIFDDKNFQTAHALGRKVRTAANQIQKATGSKKMLDLYFKCHLFDAPYWFDSFCIYIEKDREPKRKFYVPRRKQLLPCVEAMQDLEDGNLELLGISEPPGVGKTTIAEFFLAWEAGKHPELANLVGSHNNAFLNGVYGEMLRIMDRGGEYCWGDVFPDLRIINTNARNMMIDIGRDRTEGKRFMTLEFSSIGSGNAGKVRAQNLLYCDDLVDGIETAMSKDRLDKLWQMYYTDLRQRKIGDRCKELHIATRWSLYDVIGRLEQEYADDPMARFIRFSALDENDESNFDYPYGLGYTTEALHRQRDIMDDASWRALYCNEPIEREGRLYDPEEMRRYSSLPDREPDTILSICDTKEQGDDFAVMPIVYQYGQDFYIADFVCYNGKVEVIEGLIVEGLLKHKVKVCQVESNRGGTLFAQSITEKLRAAGGSTQITTKWTQSNKETRIIINSTWVKNHCLFRYESDYRTDKEYRTAMNLLFSYSMAGKNKHDDVPDVMALMAEFCMNIGGAQAEVFNRPW
ncbi:MAG: phage terminase large subunit [Acidaminococcaceae bacterium]|nr:phage terminase large subunit [Acidaminococcaceae bacterium]